jgi:hypothetical protein
MRNSKVFQEPLVLWHRDSQKLTFYRQTFQGFSTQFCKILGKNLSLSWDWTRFQLTNDVHSLKEIERMANSKWQTDFLLCFLLGQKKSFLSTSESQNVISESKITPHKVKKSIGLLVSIQFFAKYHASFLTYKHPLQF